MSDLSTGLGPNAIRVLEKRYLKKDETGQIIEDPAGMFRRVARSIASADIEFSSKAKARETEEIFYSLMEELLFLPNSPTLMNAGTPMKQLSACFVIPVWDSMESIFDAVKNMALIHQSGGGTGFSFSRLRPKNDMVRSTGGVASGPVSFMRVFDMATDVIKQGGRRRGANMGMLRVDHPDILEFIDAKKQADLLVNFNTSVGITDKFMKALDKGEAFDLVNPRNMEKWGSLPASEIFERIVSAAWEVGDPGLIFLDRINMDNPVPLLGDIEATNPCGEQPLLPFESCNLGSLNLALMTRGTQPDWDLIRRTTRHAVHFLDNVIQVNHFPLDIITKRTHITRKIGLGVMGFADMLIKLGIPYASDAALAVARDVMKVIYEEGRKASILLAEERGPFPAYHGSKLEKEGVPPIRNATITTIAPTGSISIVAGVSSGIEPIFAVCMLRKVLDGESLPDFHPMFLKMAKKGGFDRPEIMDEVTKNGTISGVKGIPEEVKKLFLTAMEIAPQWHIKMQAAFQEFVDNGVSKTVNLPESSPSSVVHDIYLLAYRLGVKGVTIYRYGSRPEQVLYLGREKRHEDINNFDRPGDCRICSV
ncbi:MAG: adenosylcobalamin-dependent ribonucleoside-diphosphate reductase [Candidatus Eremiobacteraeota bacterium]|nr:adenosylcobalamin-dependent ribonucleoside-diphosphate reductase [Candidatus Eremiobacteraeota bacterium]